MENLILPSSKWIKSVEKFWKNNPKILALFQQSADILFDKEAYDPDNFAKHYQLINYRKLLSDFEKIAFERINEMPFRGTLQALVCKNGVYHDLGYLGFRSVTTAYANYLTDGQQANTTDVSLFKWHHSGTGTNSESSGDTTLQTPTGSRVSGNQTEGASANIYHTEAQLTYASSLSITEHGVFSASTSGTLLDRTVFTAIPVDTNTEILFKYELTNTAGG